MNDELIFVDTNVLVYARDAGAAAKQTRAGEWMEFVWRSRRGRISMQVLHEFYVTVTQKLTPGIDRAIARTEVRSFLPWRPVVGDERVVERAWAVQDRFGLSWWDALIVGAGQVAGAGILLTEDLQHGQDLDGLRVVNPFEEGPPTHVSV